MIFVYIYTSANSVQAAITKCYGLGWHKQQKFISQSSGVWKPKIKVLANSVLGEKMATFSLCLAMAQKGSSGLPFFSYKDTNPTMRVPPSCSHLNLIASLRPYFSVLSHWGLRASTYAFHRYKIIVHTILSKMWKDLCKCVKRGHFRTFSYSAVSTMTIFTCSSLEFEPQFCLLPALCYWES